MNGATVNPAMPEETKQLHVAMFPWLAFGHLIPYLELSKRIAQKGHKISFISTPRNIDRLPPLPPNLSTLINFVKIPLPQSPNLPEGAEATSDIPEDQVPYLKLACDNLQEPITHFLKSSHPDWLLYDFVPYWAGNIARNFGIPSAYYNIFNAGCVAFLGPTSPDIPSDDRKLPEDFVKPPKWVTFPSTLSYRMYQVKHLADNIPGVLYRFMETMRGCDLIVVKSCTEFEPEYMNLLGVIHGKPVQAVGGLLPAPIDGDDNDETWLLIKKWLDKQSKNTVVYVAFGTEAIPTQEEVTEIALGLEKSGLPFFWVLKTKKGEDAVKLPEGFEERNEGKGIVWPSFAPQVKILAHESLGLFMSHGGWGSIVESLSLGKPMVLVPMSNDQGMNAKLLEEKKIGHEMPRDENDGSFTSEVVAESLRLVVEKEEGRVYRDNAKAMKLVFGDKERQDMYLNKFLEYLNDHKNDTKKSI